jgi:tight adherence protein C
MSVMYIILASLFAGMCAYLVVAALLDKRETEKQDRIKPARESLMRSTLFRLFVKTAGFIISIHPKRNKLSGYFSRVKKRLLLAGEPLCLTPEEFLALKELVALCMVIISPALGFSATVLFLLTIAGFFYPDLWLRELYKKRRNSILKELPYTLDLLTLSIEAGLDLTGSVSRVVEKSKKGILNTELFQFLQELKMGKARRQALTDMAGRVGVPEITSLVNAIIQSDELGSGLARTLRIQSQEYRTRRFQRAEKLAMEAPVKMTFPLLFIFISVFLLLFGSFAVQAMRGKLF